MADETKDARLAAALRANLKRRKAQARERDDVSGNGGEGAPTPLPPAART
jgi:hypothetical protein